MRNKEAALGLMVVAIIGAVFFIEPLFYAGSASTASFTVIDKDRVSFGSGDTLRHKYLVYTETETFEITDTMVFGKWSSADTYGHIKVGSTYKARVAGWRFPFFSSYRNILETTEVEQ